MSGGKFCKRGAALRQCLENKEKSNKIQPVGGQKINPTKAKGRKESSGGRGEGFKSQEKESRQFFTFPIVCRYFGGSNRNTRRGQSEAGRENRGQECQRENGRMGKSLPEERRESEIGDNRD